MHTRASSCSSSEALDCAKCSCDHAASLPTASAHSAVPISSGRFSQISRPPGVAFIASRNAYACSISTSSLRAAIDTRENRLSPPAFSLCGAKTVSMKITSCHIGSVTGCAESLSSM